MRILITNDDGIRSPGLMALVKKARERGHDVLVSAPSAQHSAGSHKITLRTPILTRKTRLMDGVPAYAVDGTPADCVRIAPQLADERIDFCISGINDGENAGSAAYYSGTVSAAREATMHGIPAVAVSLMAGASDDMRENMADVAVKLAERFKDKPLPRLCVINVNAPAIPPQQLKPLTVCTLSEAFYTDTYEKCESPYGETYFWLAPSLSMEESKPGTDYDALNRGHISCTFLCGYGDANDICGEYLHEIR